MNKICLLATSEDCSWCLRVRNRDGVMLEKASEKTIYGLRALDYDFVYRLLTADKLDDVQRWTLINVHYAPSVQQISIFNLMNENPKVVEQFIFSPTQDKKQTVRKIIFFGPDAPSSQTMVMNISWPQTVAQFVPDEKTLYYRYMIFKPIFLFYDDETRKYCLEKENWDNFYAKVINHETSTEPPYYPLRDKIIEKWDPISIVTEIEENEKLLQPPIRLSLIAPTRTSFNSRQR